jgi:soluble lytic murein transglycosylase-like protein
VSAAAAIARVAQLQSLLGLSPAAATGGAAAPTGFSAQLANATTASSAATPAAATPATLSLAPTAAPAGVASQLPASVPYGAEITAAAQRHDIDPALLAGLIKQESGFNPNAGSPAGAQGLTQLMPGTASALGVTNSLDPAQAIEGGAKYLAEQLERFGGDTARALAAYNAGPGAVQRFGGVPPYAETQNYVRIVQSNAAGFRAGSSASATA